MALVLLAAVVEEAVDVGHPVVESGEEESADGLLDSPVHAPVEECARLLVVAETLFHKDDGADAAQKERIDVVRRVFHLGVVGALGRNVVDPVDEEDQVLGL